MTNSMLILVLDLLVGGEVKLANELPVADRLVVDEDFKGAVQVEDKSVHVLRTDIGRRCGMTARGEG